MELRTISLAAMLSLIAAPALADNWTIDSSHSSANFKVKHMMVSNVNGSISGVKGTAEYDGKNVKSLKVEATLDPNTVNTNDPNRDNHLRNADFFNVAQFPTMTFKSTKVVEESNGKYKMYGDLTMHGVTKEVALNMDAPSPVLKDAHGERVGASASTTINRKDWGITWNKQLDNGGLSVGDQVDISLDVEMKKAPVATEAAPKTAAKGK